MLPEAMDGPFDQRLDNELIEARSNDRDTQVTGIKIAFNGRNLVHQSST